MYTYPIQNGKGIYIYQKRLDEIVRFIFTRCSIVCWPLANILPGLQSRRLEPCIGTRMYLIWVHTILGQPRLFLVPIFNPVAQVSQDNFRQPREAPPAPPHSLQVQA